MSTIYDVILATPHADFSHARAVDLGLADLGFSPASPRDTEVWLRLGLKLPLEYPTIDALRERVLALPWHDWGVPTHLQVLWTDEHATEDDSFHGRTEPFAWQHETWETPRRGSPGRLLTGYSQIVGASDSPPEEQPHDDR